MEASKQQNKSRIELYDNEERVKLIEDVQQILWDLTDKKQKSKARYKRRRSLVRYHHEHRQPCFSRHYLLESCTNTFVQDYFKIL
ncbi:hypothetical protein ACLKA7_005241 [Drosophila subpalustris]